MDALKAIRSKRDTRSYVEDPVAAEVVDRVLDSARMAGSAKNVQPVRLVVVTESETKHRLRDAGDFATWIHRAPVVVVVTVRSDAGPRRHFDVGRHSQNMMIAATAEGLASCPVTIHHQEVAREALGIPDDVDPSMIITLGWPAPSEAQSPIAGPRLPLVEYASHGSWGQQ